MSWGAESVMLNDAVVKDSLHMTHPLDVSRFKQIYKSDLTAMIGDAINTMMAAAAYNMRHWMNKHALSSFVSWLLTLVGRLENALFVNENKSACLRSALAMVA